MSNLNKNIYIVVAIHNRIAETLKFIESLKKSTYKNYHLLIVDDGSHDNSSTVLKSTFSKVEVLKGDGTWWWSKSMNNGIKHAITKGATHILILNNDTILDKNLLTQLIQCSNKNKKAVISSKVYSLKTNELFWGGGRAYTLLQYPFQEMVPYGKKDTKEYQIERYLKYAIGMGLFIPVKVFKKVGFLNEDMLPQYYSDIDFTLRTRKANIPILFCPSAKLYNNTDTTWRFPLSFSFRNIRDLYFHKGSVFYGRAVLYMTKNYWPKRFLWLYPFVYFVKTLPTFIAKIIVYKFTQKTL